MVDEGRHGVHRAGQHVLVRRGGDADAVGLHHAERLEDFRVGDAGHAEVAPNEGGEAGDSGLDAGVATPAPFVDSLIHYKSWNKFHINNQNCVKRGGARAAWFDWI